MKLLSLFSGIGAFEKALELLNVPFELVNYCEIDKYASKAYSLIHNIPESKNLGDITKVDTDKLDDFDIMTWGFPCQDISISGKQAGIVKGVTRSGLYYEGLRILKEKRPKYSIIENVKNLTSKRFQAQFQQILKDLENLGYTNYYKVLNAKDFGIPQSRERVFIISILNPTKPFQFPESQPLNIYLKDILEDEVSEKYYLKGKHLEWWEAHKEEQLKKRYSSLDADVAICQTARQYANRTGNFISVAAKIESITRNDRKLVLDVEEVCSCITTCEGGGRVPKILVVAKIESIGREQCQRVYHTGGICACLNTGGGGDHVPKILKEEKVRRLTPKECWRLMGFEDKDIDTCIQNGISDTQLYKMAGNSIAVNVLVEIFKKLIN